MSNILYVLTYSKSGFDLKAKQIETRIQNADYITYKLDDTGTRTNIVRTTKIGKVHRLGTFNYVGYFTDKTEYSKLKAIMWNLIDEDIKKLEVELYHQKKQQREFLISKLGESL